jgi:hypothetical protein
METQHKRAFEIIAVLLVWAVLFMGVVVPAQRRPVEAGDRGADGRPDDRHEQDRPDEQHGDLPDTARGWLLVILGVPVLLGYMFLRPRLTGETVEAYWNDPFRDDE